MKIISYVKAFLFLFFLCSLLGSFHAEGSESNRELLSPPKPWPVKVETSFYLLDLVSLDELTETFEADIYLRLKWVDPRLAFKQEKNAEPFLVFTGGAARNKLKQIWWPELEFVNTSTPQYTNQTLIIHVDGTIECLLGITGRFRGQLNFKRFPFDQQTLEIVIRSFVWDDKVLEFVSDLNPVSLGTPQPHSFSDFFIGEVKAGIVPIKDMGGYGFNDYSTLIVSISIKRDPSFYIYQFFIPLFILMGISFSVFYVETEQLSSRLMLILSAMFVFIAIKFALSQTLPKIAYMTILEKVLFIAYLVSGLCVAISIIEHTFAISRHPMRGKIDRQSRWFVPVLFALLVFWAMYFSGY